MKIEQKVWTKSRGWEPGHLPASDPEVQLVLVFCDAQLLKDENPLQELNKAFPGAVIFGCSTAGEIYDKNVFENSLTLCIISFEHTTIKSTRIQVNGMENSYKAGEELVKSLSKEDLKHILVLSDGLNVNGSELVNGMTINLPQNVTVTGGLSGDGERFKETFVIFNGKPESGIVAAIGFYGSRLKVGYGSLGGWDSFGPIRLITRSKGNILYELDGKSALSLYKTYLGEHASGLPATGLLFPLSIRIKDRDQELVRTILSVDEKEQSLIFAGDVPEGSYARLMKSNFDRLIDGSIGAAEITHQSLNGEQPDLAILISCVGRKLVLKQRVEEEVEGVSEILGAKTILTGFYSYGEISPFRSGERCELHNQTMTITTFLEK